MISGEDWDDDHSMLGLSNFRNLYDNNDIAAIILGLILFLVKNYLISPFPNIISSWNHEQNLPILIKSIDLINCIIIQNSK